MSNQNNGKITRTRLTDAQKQSIDTALQNRGDDTLASIATANKVSISAVAIRARALGLTKIRAPKSPLTE